MSSSSLLEALLDNRSTLIKTAARITGCHSRAEDVVQDAFLRLVNTPMMSLPLRAQISYVFRIVRNLAIDHYRKQAMEQRYSGSEEEGLNVAVQGSTPESQSLDHEALMIVDTALNELPKRTRYAFECYRLHGIPQKDIAKELGVSPTLVNFMIRDAMVHCRKALSSEYERTPST
ncbi:RNA polymerase factor sigma-70 [Phytopseudomonas dryadis]|uniref:RNA polymerase factor sigma-70 n=1 Tax=Phytopseudomonas dryadis TaxID=2487520 RepID=A0A4Q9QVL6_9GAMM|nr:MULTISPECIES: RNA polymerase factor sigma-70 [Pseudomonas]TBU85679.1 RNA polymerase factor sigma-70 [Pseudomonas dryadis]TBV09275.1 RNA polymerase factor sigma-70 [Pseudomonas dryadis]TBV12993.1 RNA polymerase factor sigma-70 [Pseudomonas sp. FRB 230]